MERLSLYKSVETITNQPAGCKFATGERNRASGGFTVWSWHRTLDGACKQASKAARNGYGRTLVAEDDRS